VVFTTLEANESRTIAEGAVAGPEVWKHGKGFLVGFTRVGAHGPEAKAVVVDRSGQSKEFKIGDGVLKSLWGFFRKENLGEVFTAGLENGAGQVEYKELLGSFFWDSVLPPITPDGSNSQPDVTQDLEGTFVLWLNSTNSTSTRYADWMLNGESFWNGPFPLHTFTFPQEGSYTPRSSFLFNGNLADVGTSVDSTKSNNATPFLDILNANSSSPVVTHVPFTGSAVNPVVGAIFNGSYFIGDGIDAVNTGLDICRGEITGAINCGPFESNGRGIFDLSDIDFFGTKTDRWESLFSDQNNHVSALSGIFK
jgi:hypothetical protein